MKKSRNYIFQQRISRVLFEHHPIPSQLWTAFKHKEVKSNKKSDLKVFLGLLHENFLLFISFALLKLKTGLGFLYHQLQISWWNCLKDDKANGCCQNSNILKQFINSFEADV